MKVTKFDFLYVPMKNMDRYRYDNSVMDVTIHLHDYVKLCFIYFTWVFKPPYSTLTSDLSV